MVLDGFQAWGCQCRFRIIGFWILELQPSGLTAFYGFELWSVRFRQRVVEFSVDGAVLARRLVFVLLLVLLVNGPDPKPQWHQHRVRGIRSHVPS